MTDGFEYDSNAKKVKFLTHHFSEYMVEVVDAGVTVTIDDRTNKKAVIVAPEKGTVGEDYTITVTNDIACVVLVKTGVDSYERLTAVKKEGEDNTYEFTTKLTDGMSFVVAVKGDVSLDGAFTAQDVNQVRLAAGGKITLDVLPMAIADITGDGIFTAQDVNQVRLISGGKISATW